LKQMPSNRALNSLDDVLECDREARHQATELIEATSV
jgi:1-deoxy-D-xylulose 5-phosphate reductoisomerase